MLIPRASKKSAEPDFEETARFPCFAITCPQLAAIRAERDEMLKLPFPSPPVPTISARPDLSSGTLVFFLSMTSAAPAISSAVGSPREAMAVKTDEAIFSSIIPSVSSPMNWAICVRSNGFF